MAMKDRMHTGALYLPGDDEIMDRQRLCLDRLYEFNHTRPSETDKRQALMKEMFAELGENCYIEPPFYSNFGGAHVHLGNHVYCNFAVTMVDDTHIYIGDNTMIAPNVTIATAGPSGAAGAAGVRLPIQYAGAHWPYLLDRRRSSHPARRYRRRQYGHRRRVRRYQRHSRQCSGGGQPLPGAAPHQ